MIFSFSRLNLYLQCPFRFFLKYVEEREERLTKSLALGKAVHRAIEDIIKGYSFEEAMVNGYIESEFHEEVTYDEMAKLVRNAPINKGMGETELHFELPLDDSPDAPVIQGYIDLIYDGEHAFIDWKTNWKAYDVWGNYQIPLYAWAYMKTRRVSSVRGSLYFLRFRKESSFLFTDEHVEQARLWALNLANEIRKKLFLLEIFPTEQDNLFPAKPSSHCSHCSFAKECFYKFTLKEAEVHELQG